MDKLSENIGKAAFSKSLRGYTTGEVDRYVRDLTEAYSALYRENAELEQKLADAEDKIAELNAGNTAIEEAKKKAGEIVREAYENADGVLFSIKSNCDSILKSFRKKIEDQRTILSSLKGAVETFQFELFEKYRAHIELIEQLKSSKPDDEEILSADDYVERVVTSLKSDISAEYGISLDSLEVPEGVVKKPVEEYHRKPVSKKAAAKAAEGSDKEFIPAQEQQEAPSMRIPSALEMLSEYERRQAQKFEEDGIQLALDIEAGTTDPSEK